MQVVTRRGATTWTLTEQVAANEVDVRGKRVVGIFCATNQFDARLWAGASAQEQAQRVWNAYEALIDTILEKNPSAFLIFISVIPRPCDHSRTHRAVQLFNQKLYHKAREMSMGFAPMWKGFVNNPKPGFAAVVPDRSKYTSGGLHLSKKGAETLNYKFRQLFGRHNLRAMALRSNFQLDV